MLRSVTWKEHIEQYLSRVLSLSVVRGKNIILPTCTHS